VGTIEVPWAGKHSRFTLMFESFAIEVLLACGNVESARKLLGLSWRQVDEIRMRAVERGLGRRKLQEIPFLGIDEKSFGRGHDYVSVLTDVKGSRVLDVSAGRDSQAAQALIGALPPSQARSVAAVAMDMWPAYINTCENALPAAEVVHDRFHVTMLLSNAVDRVRRVENRSLSRRGDWRLKGTKHLWLRHPGRLEAPLKERLEQLKQDSLKVAKAWHLKQLFEEFWTFDFVEDARHFLKWWMGQVNRSRLKPMIKAAQTLLRHWNGLIAYTCFPITNACTEGFNSKIQAIKSAARGFRSFQKYRAAILFYCGKLDLFPQNS
jgi:transposase